MTYRRDFRLRAHTLVALPFFAGAAWRIGASGGMTAVERMALIVIGAAYVTLVAVVFVIEARRRVVTGEDGIERRGSRGFRMAWADVTEVRERYRPRGSRLGAILRSFDGRVTLVSADGREGVIDAGFRPYRDLVREIAERTTEPILARLAAPHAEGVVLAFGSVRVERDVLLFPLSKGGFRRVRFGEVTGLRLHQGALIFYFDGRWLARRLDSVVNPYVLMELLLRGGAGRSPGPPPESADLEALNT